MVHVPGRSIRWSVRLGWMVSLVAALLLWVGCGAQDLPAPHDQPDSGCAPGELLLESGECQPAGLPPDMPCPPGEWPSEDGTCQAAGVPPEACVEGFEPDSNGGCNAILPADACPLGQMAVPGETSCREVAPCGDGPWGTIPVEANTQFVDQAYAGGDSDGTMAKPWTTVQQGVDTAAGGAIVAVTDGVYEEDVRIEGKAVRLWGRCPGRVEIHGTEVEGGAVEIFGAGADEAEIRSLAVTGVRVGIVLSGASDVQIAQVWAHNAGDRGINIEDAYGPTSVTVQGSLVEQNHDVGVFVGGSDADLVATVVRDTQPLNGQAGQGITIRDDSDTGARANVYIHGCAVEENHDVGVVVFGSDAELVATVVRGTQTVNGKNGIGIWIGNDRTTGERANVDIRGCVVEQNHDVCVMVFGSDVELVATAVRDSQPVNGQLGSGIWIQDNPYTGERAKVIIRGCVFEQNHGVGVFVGGSDAELVATVVRDSQPVNGQFGRGIHITDDPSTGERAKVVIRGCAMEKNHEQGVFVGGSDAELEATVVRDTQPVSGQFGRGISIQQDIATGVRAKVVIRGCAVEQNHDVGVFVGGSDAELEATVVRDTQPVNGLGGRGISIQHGPDEGERANVVIRGCAVEQNHDLGVYIDGSDVELEATVVRGTQPLNGQSGRGIGIQYDTATGERANVVIRGCVAEQNHELGMFVGGSDVKLEATVVRDTAANADGSFGDGIVVLNGTAMVQSATIIDNARAGVANFGSEVTILSSTITCNAFDLNGETIDGIPFSFAGSDDWQCSSADAEDCTETDTCHVLSAGLAPPPPIEPSETPL